MEVVRSLPLTLMGLLAAGAAAAAGLDTGFGTGGMVIFNGGAASSSQVHAAILQADGKIVAVGSSPAVLFDGTLGSADQVDASRDFLIVRFNRDGSPDASFGTAGVVKVDFNGDDDRATGVVQEPGGKLVVVGAARSTHGDFDYAAVRLNVDGTVDSSFATGGKFTLNQPKTIYEGPNNQTIISQSLANNVATGIALLPNGEFAVTGNLQFNPLNSQGNSVGATVQVFRLTSNGAFDPTYNASGGGFRAANTAPSAPFASITSLSDGEVNVVAATAVRISADGDNIVATYYATIQPGVTEFLSACNQVDGTLLLGGANFVSSSSQSGYQLSATVTHLDSAYKADAAFGTQGVALNFAGPVSNSVTALVADPAGNVFAAGATVLASDPLGRELALVARLRSNGSPDVNFGANGIQQIDFDPQAQGYSMIPTSVLRTPEGKIVIVGNRGTLSADYPEETYINGTTQIALAELDPAPAYSAAASGTSVSESAGKAMVQLTRAGATTSAVSVDYTTTDGTALAGTDYTAVSGIATWQAGDADTKTISIPIIDGHIHGGSRQFSLQLSNPTEGTVVSATATISITEDDAVSPPSSGSGSPGGGASGGGGGGAMDWLTCLGLACIGPLARRRRLH